LTVAAEDDPICGIFGAIAPKGKKINLAIIRALTWANRERGTDSCGFFNSTGKMTKRAGDPSKLLLNEKVSKWLKASRDSSWFVAGHTRQATRGAVNRRNSHPFRYGRVIGSHNGMCDAPAKFRVDSEYLFWSLNKKRGDYNKALDQIGGYWGLSWFDGEDFYLMSHHGELAVVEVEGVWYYSSSWKHLDSCTGGDCHTFGEGEVWKFNANGLVGSSNVEGSGVKPFVSSGSKWGYYTTFERSGGASFHTAATSNHRNHTPRLRSAKAAGKWWENADQTESATSGSAEVRDYDQEWVDAWGTYCDDESAHSMSDEEFKNSEYAG
jgi:hypothetical protein